MASKYRNSGQTCVCANRIYVQDGIYDALAEHLVEAVSKLKVSDGRQEGSTQGPLIDEVRLLKSAVLTIADATEKAQQFVLVVNARHLAVHSLNRLC